MSTFRTSLCPIALLLAATQLALAQGTYTQIDVSGAVQTQLTGINAAGDVVGLYIDSAGGHGFLLSNGTYTTIDYPGSQYSYLYGINDQGQMVGTAEPNGYLYDTKTQTFTTINYPDAAFTYPQGINNAGTIVGYSQHQKGNNYFTDGFVLSGSNYQLISPQGAKGTMVYGVSRSGELVGYTVLGSTAVNFFYSQGRFRKIALTNLPGAQVYGINPQGTVYVGSYDALSGVTGFLYQNHTAQFLSFPNSITTVASGINAGGEVVGYFIDQSYGVHGFTWTPDAPAREK
jgi:probable HAF family extracellular repeat protein